jgi:DNA polymerase I-like protein with 3'-5' exonuclease and polymerase domains
MITFDIETNGLLDVVNTIHCISLYDGDGYHTFDPVSARPISEALQMLERASVICGHNIISYDIPAIKRVHPEWTCNKVLDTLVWARLAFPDIKQSDFGRFKAGRIPGNMIGRYSLESFGYRLGELKGDYGKTTDWAEWTPEMSTYCEQDVRITVQLLERLQTQEVSQEALDLEHEVAAIIARQEQKGFLFDLEAAGRLHGRLIERHEELQRELQKIFPPFYVKAQTKPFTPKADNKRFHYVAGCPMTKIKLVDFNANSRGHISKMLRRKYNWVPSEFTENTGEPKIDETILNSLPYPEAKLIAEYMLIEKRIGQLATGKEAWLKHVKDDGRIHGAVNSCGAVSGRMTHFSPNLAQVPSNGSPYGKDCRALFIVPSGRKLVGCDAAGLEARTLAHYLARYDKGAFGKAVLEGKKEEGTDVHTMNMKALGIHDRNVAKRWFYAWMYGAGNAKLGEILGGGPALGKKKGEQFLEALPAFKKLINAVKKKAKETGVLRGLDRRKLQVRSEHSALNILLQSAGAVIMKKALVIMDQAMKAEGLDYEFVGNIHDEVQIEVRAHDAHRVGELARLGIIKAGAHYNTRCPMDGEYEIGTSWAETH